MDLVVIFDDMAELKMEGGLHSPARKPILEETIFVKFFSNCWFAIMLY